MWLWPPGHWPWLTSRYASSGSPAGAHHAEFTGFQARAHEVGFPGCWIIRIQSVPDGPKKRGVAREGISLIQESRPVHEAAVVDARHFTPGTGHLEEPGVGI